MTSLLNRAMSEAQKLSPAEQDAIGTLILEEIESERRWDELFATSQDVLERLAEEALDEHRAGRTEELDLGKL